MGSLFLIAPLWADSGINHSGALSSSICSYEMLSEVVTMSKKFLTSVRPTCFIGESLPVGRESLYEIFVICIWSSIIIEKQLCIVEWFQRNAGSRILKVTNWSLTSRHRQDSGLSQSLLPLPFLNRAKTYSHPCLVIIPKTSSKTNLFRQRCQDPM